METLQQYDTVVQSWMFYHRSVCQYRQMLYSSGIPGIFSGMIGAEKCMTLTDNYFQLQKEKRKKKKRQVEF